jgi:periplasmic protein TonB
MAKTTAEAGRELNPSAGHLLLHLEGDRVPDEPFLFEWQGKRTGWSLAASLAINATLLALIIILPRLFPRTYTSAAILPELPNEHIVWLPQKGPGGGGGGGGNQMKEPPRKAELPGKDKITVPVEKPVAPKPEPPKKEPELIAQLNIPAKTLAESTQSLPGAIEAPPGPPTFSQGPGNSGGAGTGSGTGIGPGTGSGLGPGSGGGTGGGIYRPGSGVTLPEIITEVKPAYTSDAMRAKVQGTVLLEAVVRPDGSVSEVRIVRSLDPTFGLDNEAVKAARQWRFRPGMRLGQPVPVLITIELMFTLR